MASTEGRVAKPERRWGCHRGTFAALIITSCSGSAAWCHYL